MLTKNGLDLRSNIVFAVLLQSFSKFEGKITSECSKTVRYFYLIMKNWTVEIQLKKNGTIIIYTYDGDEHKATVYPASGLTPEELQDFLNSYLNLALSIGFEQLVDILSNLKSTSRNSFIVHARQDI
ncbi:hypothetical protein ACVRXS_00075 [Streptococcus orisratti]|uniref:hypothetical protein n=1 Tax=Streptococcus orisratti TaxID=114652 RepID=UPI00037873D7|nr:hypothetical protein [Streptococcus orisratti]